MIETCKRINDQGINLKLHLVGLKNAPDNLPDFVINHGFLSKNNEEQYKELQELYSSCHFLMVPSLGECYGLVFCEASANGLPSISTNVGGIPTVVKNGRNGFLFDLPFDNQKAANKMIELFLDKDKYMQLALNARKEFDNRLNWKVAGQTLSKLMQQE